MKKREYRGKSIKSILKYLAIILAALVVFVTTYSLILPAITIEEENATEEAGFFEEAEEVKSKLSKSVISASGETYAIDVAYDEAAGIPDGAELNVREIIEGTEEYQKYLSEAGSGLDPENGAISFARFFDIQILYDGETIEPNTAVGITISYMDPIEVNAEDTLSVVHFAEEEESPEIINDVALVDQDTTVVYDQESFSVTGTVVQTPAAAHHYSLVIHHTDGNYYVIENDGTLTYIPLEDITFNGDGSVKSVKLVTPIAWTYQDIGYSNYNIWHNTDAWQYDVPGTSLPKRYERRFLNVDDANGYQDVHDTSVNVWSEAVQYNSNTHRINHYDNYLGVTTNASGQLVICGLQNSENSAEIYFAEAQQVLDANVRNHTVNHIDISVEGSAGIKVPLAYGSYRLATVDDNGNIT